MPLWHSHPDRAGPHRERDAVSYEGLVPPPPDRMTGLVRQAEELGMYEATDGVNPLRSEQPSPDELADAERWLRLRGTVGPSVHVALQTLLAEYDRRGADLAEARERRVSGIDRALFGTEDGGYLADEAEVPVGELRRLLREYLHGTRETP
ncbi:MAG: hypothetical protein JWO11_3536 [Nocardioides sp.]|nr:hypothetical protein [Nocardioides sp.]